MNSIAMYPSRKLPELPAKPGVYLLKDASGGVVYVGKATNLRNRVRFYFAPPARLAPKSKRMMEQVRDVEVIIAESEQEALILECNLIKRYRPRYNVRLKDDKSFPYLRIDVENEWPRICITRRPEKGNGRYFGPYANAGSVRRTVALLQKLFPFRSCAKVPSGSLRACLDFHIQRCLGPCVGAVTREEYNEMVRQVVLFLEGRQDRVVRDLKHRMEQAAADLEYEKAALIRNQIQAIEQVIEGQKLAAAVKGDQDVIAFVRSNDLAYVETFFIRNGKLTGREHFLLEGVRDVEPEEIAASFIKQFYTSATSIPPSVLMAETPAEKAALESWLQGKRGGRVRLWTPQRGEKSKLVKIVSDNARQGMEHFRQKQLISDEALRLALAELQERLQLKESLERIECYDISDIQGTSAVGSMAVFEKGLPRPDCYRRFRIKGIEQADDYAMLQEVLRRRFARVQASGYSIAAENDWAARPDLIIIDGGKGQLHAAQKAMQEVGLDIPLISIAKEREEIFTPNQGEPLVFPSTSPALYLVQRIRDEAHRFALSYHKKVRTRTLLKSDFDSIEGVGSKRRRALLQKFGSRKAIKEAPLESLAATVGIGPALAKKIKASL